MSKKAIDQSLLNVAEAVLRGMIEQIGPQSFSVALNNACVHGEVFKENFNEYLEWNDDFLQDWFKGIEKLSNAVKRKGSDFYDKTTFLLDDIVNEAFKKYSESDYMTYVKTVRQKFDSYALELKDLEAVAYLKAELNRLRKLKSKK